MSRAASRSIQTGPHSAGNFNLASGLNDVYRAMNEDGFYSYKLLNHYHWERNIKQLVELGTDTENYCITDYLRKFKALSCGELKWEEDINRRACKGIVSILKRASKKPRGTPPTIISKHEITVTRSRESLDIIPAVPQPNPGLETVEEGFELASIKRRLQEHLAGA